jgi:predicted dehydrogenase
MAEFELVGCFDIDRPACESQAEKYGIKAFQTYDQLCASVDVVHIVVPSSLHREYAVLAALAGCHVLVEKPLALTLEDADTIIATCHTAGVKLCVGHVERFNPAITTLQGVMAKEELISLDFWRMSPFTSRVKDASVVEDLMIHDIDVLNSLIDAPIKRIASQGSKVFSKRLDFAQALITFENGVLASLTASRVTETKIRRAEISAKRSYILVDYLNRTVEVSRKTHFSLDVGYPVQYRQENAVERILVPISEPLRAEFEHFYACIISDTPVATSGEAGRRALELCQQIQEAAILG